MLSGWAGGRARGERRRQGVCCGERRRRLWRRRLWQMTVTRPPTAAMADLEAQIASLTELMAQHPRRVDLVFGRASAYRSAGKLEEAVADFAKVRALVCVYERRQR